MNNEKQIILQLSKDLSSYYPDFPILQVPLAKLENEGTDFVQVPLAQIS